jgi:hypothetical protein
MKHHEFSPSKLERFASCPWSYKNCQGWESTSGSEASHGTLLHEAVWNDEVLAGLSEKDAALVNTIRKEHVTPYAKLNHYHELKLQVHDDEGNLLTEGIADFVVISPDKKAASLKDWKFGGYQVTDAEKNQQMKTYVCGIFQQWPTVERVFSMVVQPAFGYADYDKQAEFRREQLPEMLSEIEEIIQKCKAAVVENANPSADNCRYCNKDNCPAFRRKMDANFSIMAINPDEIALPEQELTIEYADRLLCAEKEIKAIMEERTKTAKEIILQQGGSENFRVQAGRVSRKTDWKALAADMDIPEEKISEFTTETAGEPYLMPRMRKKTKQLN